MAASARRIERDGIAMVVLSGPGETWMRVGEAAAEFDCPRTTIHYLARQGKIRTSRPPRGVTRYHRDDLAEHFGYPQIAKKERG
jgi:hypothetical protein